MWSLSILNAKPLLSTYYMQDFVLGVGNTVWPRQIPAFGELTF